MKQYDPQQYLENSTKEQNICVNMVVIDLQKEALVPINIDAITCNALIDTGASRSCMSEEQYQKLVNPAPIQGLLSLQVRSATGNDLQALGTTSCIFSLGDKQYKFDFVVCKKLRRPMILGLDFLRTYRIGTGWSPQGSFVLQQEEEILIEAVETCRKGPSLRVRKTIKIPP